MGAVARKKQHDSSAVKRYRGRPFLGGRRGGRLALDPHRLGLLGGVACATLALFAYVVRQRFGGPMLPSEVLVGVSATFVVSYALIGIFVWYLLRLAEHEFGPPGGAKRGRETAEEASEQEAAGESPPETTSEE